MADVIDTIELAIVENQPNSWSFTDSRVDDTWSARMEFRLGSSSRSSSVLISLADGDGITLAAGGGSWALSEDQTDALVEAARTAGQHVVYSSLKLISPTEVATQLFIAEYTFVPTPTA